MPHSPAIPEGWIPQHYPHNHRHINKNYHSRRPDDQQPLDRQGWAEAAEAAQHLGKRPEGNPVIVDLEISSVENDTWTSLGTPNSSSARHTAIVTTTTYPRSTGGGGTDPFQRLDDLAAENVRLRAECGALRGTLEASMSMEGRGDSEASAAASAEVIRILTLTRPRKYWPVGTKQSGTTITTSTQTPAAPLQTTQSTQSPPIVPPPPRPETVTTTIQTTESALQLADEKDGVIVAQATRVRELSKEVEDLKTQLTHISTRLSSTLTSHSTHLATLTSTHTTHLTRLTRDLEQTQTALQHSEQRVTACEDEIIHVHARLQDQVVANKTLKKEIATHEKEARTQREQVDYLKELLEKAVAVTRHTEAIPKPIPTPVAVCSVGTDTTDLEVEERPAMHEECEERINLLEEGLKSMTDNLDRSETAHKTTKIALTTTRTTLTALKTQLQETQTSLNTLSSQHTHLTSTHKTLQSLHASTRTHITALQQRLTTTTSTHAGELAAVREEMRKASSAELKRVTRMWAARVERAEMLRVVESEKVDIQQDEGQQQQQKLGEKGGGKVAKQQQQQQQQQPHTKFQRLVNVLERAVAAWVWSALHRAPRPTQISPQPRNPQQQQQRTPPPAMMQKLDHISRSILNVDFQTIISPPPTPPAVGAAAVASRIADADTFAAVRRIRDILLKRDFEDDLVKYLGDLWVQLTHDL